MSMPITGAIYNSIFNEVETLYTSNGSLKNYRISLESEKAQLGNYSVSYSQLDEIIKKASQRFATNKMLLKEFYSSIINAPHDKRLNIEKKIRAVNPEYYTQGIFSKIGYFFSYLITGCRKIAEILQVRRIRNIFRFFSGILNKKKSEEPAKTFPVTKILGEEESLEALKQDIDLVRDLEIETDEYEEKYNSLKNIEDQTEIIKRVLDIRDNILTAALPVAPNNSDIENKTLNRLFEVLVAKIKEEGIWPKYRNPLHVAALSDNVELIRRLLNVFGHDTLKIYVNRIHKDKDGLTPLFIAVSQKKFKAAKELIRLGGDLNIKLKKHCKLGFHYIHYWVNKNMPEQVKFCVEEENINHLVKTYEQRNILHLAAKLPDTTILKYLLESGKCRPCLEEKDIYGCKPLQTAEGERNDSAITLLKTACGITPPPTPSEKPAVKIQQGIIADKLRSYLGLRKRKTINIDERGLCNGLTFLKAYETQKRIFKGYDTHEDEFKKKCELICNWDGTEDSLKDKESVKTLSGTYEDLEDLFEQMANDVIWFQHLEMTPSTETYTVGEQNDREKQFAIVSGNTNDRLVKSVIPISTSIDVTVDQLAEIIDALSSRPGLALEISKNKHITCLNILPRRQVDYYDSNLEYFLKPTNDFHKIAQLICQTFFLILSGSNQPVSENEINNPSESLDFETFHIEFSGKRYPYAEEAGLPQELLDRHSFNGFTPLHLAIIADDKEKLGELIANADDNEALFFTRDIHNKTPLEWAADAGNLDNLLLKMKSADYNTEFITKLFNECSIMYKISRAMIELIKKYYPAADIY